MISFAVLCISLCLIQLFITVRTTWWDKSCSYFF